MTKNRRQKKNEQQTCSVMEIIAGFLLLAGFAATVILYHRNRQKS